MDPHKLAVTLAIAAGWLSFNSLIICIYFLLSGRGVLESGMWRGGEWLKLGKPFAPNDKSIELPVHPSTAAAQVNTSSTLPEQNSVEEVAPEQDEADEYSAAHVLFVMYSQPDIAVNKKLQLCLQKWEAHYETDLQVYSVPGVTPQNSLRVANAYPPGVMPVMESFQQADNLIRGVSVILKKPKRKRGFDKVQLEKLITFTQELAALGGEILDAQRQAATSETFYAIRHK
ncbi:cell division protein ZipA C-terminal FtsZ-binding domain-containing protein [Vreelandella neptunia]|uniref:Cell division protein ZipA C-terminal FtsZ-binding domain-containing protein n=1 Tax=Vreelandella neptunia TaxID=115551 RepID=A0ABS9S6A0_9GAMM|nr:cell division protein ZipA C-terminal FtsZ-binding domain-containing protein [Halomonas neptunia]MCH4811650.1 cell division protein ZipA C-terminal FtsZ-binding domain-containing protein [Halomonas neptunia]